MLRLVAGEHRLQRGPEPLTGRFPGFAVHVLAACPYGRLVTAGWLHRTIRAQPIQMNTSRVLSCARLYRRHAAATGGPCDSDGRGFR